MTQAIKSGFAIHCHHDVLFEYCYDYEGRVEAIKQDKPENEQEIRLRLFKLLPSTAIAELPERLIKAYAEWKKADAEWGKADRAAWHKKWCGCKEWDGKKIVFKEGKP